MSATLSSILNRLEKLVAIDTRNPPRAMDGAHPLVIALRDELPGFDIDVHDMGEGCVQILAVRGAPKTLINVHMDTVPHAPGWTHSPFAMQREADRVVGLGTCDIKGAAACVIEAALASEAPAAFLFTTDEENGAGLCVSEFAARDHGFARVIVSEPTGARAVFAHRGIASFAVTFAGTSMHGSDVRCVDESAISRAADWLHAAADLARASEREGGVLPGIRFNPGRIEGGIKPNICAPDCALRFGVRPGPGHAIEDVARELQALAPADHWDSFKMSYTLPVLSPEGAAGEAARAYAQALGLPVGDPVDFWTEAALFAAQGTPVFVFGPGHIEQAHTVDEWVSHDQLMAAFAVYEKVFAPDD
ncbi:MAG: acetylornithine deacetylase [Robiginitomaculum sp.]|nr:MAG: acetylornithine deacetylase [Robiginitomaculum sp.]